MLITSRNFMSLQMRSKIGIEAVPRVLRIAQSNEKRRFEASNGMRRREQVITDLGRIDSRGLLIRNFHDRFENNVGLR